MARFVAVCDVPNLTEAQFRDALGEVRKWRFDRKGWIVKAYCDIDQGNVIAECEAPDRAKFEEWLQHNGWENRQVYDVSYIHEAAAIWPV